MLVWINSGIVSKPFTIPNAVTRNNGIKPRILLMVILTVSDNDGDTDSDRVGMMTPIPEAPRCRGIRERAKIFRAEVQVASSVFLQQLKFV